MKHDDYCPHCKGGKEEKNGKPCDECAGTGLAGGGYTSMPIPKVNGWNIQHVLEFAIALVILVFALIAVGLYKVWEFFKFRKV